MRRLLQKIDTLPSGPDWTCSVFEITGDEKDHNGCARTEDVELWHRDPVECVRELLGNPEFKDNMGYTPQRIYTNADGTNQEYTNMWTSSWWWETQVSLAANDKCARY